MCIRHVAQSATFAEGGGRLQHGNDLHIVQVVPPWAFLLLAGSKRLHSIYLLRLFNDGAAMCVAYVALAVLAIGVRPSRNGRSTCICYVPSTQMN